MKGRDRRAGRRKRRTSPTGVVESDAPIAHVEVDEVRNTVATHRHERSIEHRRPGAKRLRPGEDETAGRSAAFAIRSSRQAGSSAAHTPYSCGRTSERPASCRIEIGVGVRLSEASDLQIGAADLQQARVALGGLTARRIRQRQRAGGNLASELAFELLARSSRGVVGRSRESGARCRARSRRSRRQEWISRCRCSIGRCLRRMCVHAFAAEDVVWRDTGPMHGQQLSPIVDSRRQFGCEIR